MCGGRTRRTTAEEPLRRPHEDPATPAGDADRERMASTVGAAAGAGLLSLDEVDERLGRTFAARTRGDLAAVVADLPTDWLRERRRAEEAAAAAAAARVTLRRHVGGYVGIMAVLVVVWALTTAGYFWPVWPAVGMGFGLAGHIRAARPALPGRPGRLQPLA
jgi:hypothetical protein